MNIAVFSVTENGRQLSQRVSGLLGGEHKVSRYCFHKHTDDDAAVFWNIGSMVGRLFERSDAFIFICACGIAVRAVTPYIGTKADDPAVIVMDDCGRFVIPVLSGHIGGANRLSEVIAERIDATAVITTATDTGGKFSPDSFAVANNLIITDLKAAKDIAAAVLDDEKIGFSSSYSHSGLPEELTEFGICRTGIYIGTDRNAQPFDVTLRLIPRNIVLGIGCKKGTSCEAIMNAAEEVLGRYQLDMRMISKICTIDIKKDEKGLLEFCEKNGCELTVFTAEELMSVSGDFEPSGFVLETTGADNVCERSAVLGSGGKLIIRKNALDGVTVAAAEMPVYLDFERKVL
ncbi:MAG: cobalt-precorrin 5A hydrolase [Ruminococcus sp.]|uniref:cobalt-precorrin 5A hydrolase n=1 Tax=Ruminococcus sp. TaxID=41978 RepID=UPI0025EC30A6|nr:cobalt-precorrin 5A hydrolase [Ruminococcus sp.]MCR5600908.1 cobalt-precorrin 5A hydrolase [Ruminococcus sp.]